MEHDISDETFEAIKRHRRRAWKKLDRYGGSPYADSVNG